MGRFDTVIQNIQNARTGINTSLTTKNGTDLSTIRVSEVPQKIRDIKRPMTIIFGARVHFRTSDLARYTWKFQIKEKASGHVVHEFSTPSNPKEGQNGIWYYGSVKDMSGNILYYTLNGASNTKVNNEGKYTLTVTKPSSYSSTWKIDDNGSRTEIDVSQSSNFQSLHMEVLVGNFTGINVVRNFTGVDV